MMPLGKDTFAQNSIKLRILRGFDRRKLIYIKNKPDIRNQREKLH